MIITLHSILLKHNTISPQMQQAAPASAIEEAGINASTYAGTSFYPTRAENITDKHSASILKGTFISAPSLILWNSVSFGKFTSLPSTDGNVSYTVPRGVHYVRSSRLYMKTPELNIKPEFIGTYRMCYTDYLGYSICPEATILCGAGPNPRLTSYYCVAHLQRCSGLYQKSRAIRAGQHDSLTRWTSRLKSYELTPYQPWWYGERHISAFPYYRLSAIPDAFMHTYIFNLNIMSHIRMQKFDKYNCLWEDIDPIEGVINGIPVTKCFPTPELHGNFSMVAQTELDGGDGMDQNEAVPCHMDTILSFGDEKEYEYNASMVKEIETGDLLFKTMFISAQNVKSDKFGQHFDMTATSLCEDENATPIDTVSVKYGTTSKLFERAVRLEDTEEFDGSAMDRGYLAYSNSTDGTIPGVNVGVCSGVVKTSLTVKLETKTNRVDAGSFRIIVDAVATISGKIENGVFVCNEKKKKKEK